MAGTLTNIVKILLKPILQAIGTPKANKITKVNTNIKTSMLFVLLFF